MYAVGRLKQKPVEQPAAATSASLQAFKTPGIGIVAATVVLEQ